MYTEESGFIGNAVSTKVCQHITTMNFVLGVLSVALANSMILMRVAALWEHRRVVVFLLSAVLFISYSAVLGLIIAVIPRVLGECSNSLSPVSTRPLTCRKRGYNTTRSSGCVS
jgi:hypothetical protein